MAKNLLYPALSEKSQSLLSRRFVAFLTSTLLVLLVSSVAKAQCGFGPGEGCSGTDYTNSFSNSTTAATLEYDNFTSSYHIWQCA
jgi:hypothetical protein